ncbi:MAG: hypothetical protein K8I29_19510 [Alphaproteobacteria bacterium]|uniref:Uncharacterized protein n=1 Tax=Candidatus Nitrobium versatile TaxID=2884831 RepID=A0A953M3U0_9BACT|nr:hypothetical protein [Candidatus Nitrobium versatile]
MPLANFSNLGEVIDAPLFKGTITSLDSGNDTATVEVTIPEIYGGGVRSFAGVPLFYHCSDGAAQRGNGALEGAAAAFSEGDKVFVQMLGGGTVAQRVLGHLGEKRPCCSLALALNDPAETYFILTAALTLKEIVSSSQVLSECKLATTNDPQPLNETSSQSGSETTENLLIGSSWTDLCAGEPPYSNYYLSPAMTSRTTVNSVIKTLGVFGTFGSTQTITEAATNTTDTLSHTFLCESCSWTLKRQATYHKQSVQETDSPVIGSRLLYERNNETKVFTALLYLHTTSQVDDYVVRSAPIACYAAYACVDGGGEVVPYTYTQVGATYTDGYLVTPSGALLLASMEAHVDTEQSDTCGSSSYTDDSYSLGWSVGGMNIAVCSMGILVIVEVVAVGGGASSLKLFLFDVDTHALIASAELSNPYQGYSLDTATPTCVQYRK